MRAEAESARASHWSPGRSLLVEILLHEGDGDAALAEAHAGGCAEHLWMKLAQALEASRPADAAAIYRARVEPIVSRTNNGAYDEAAKLASRIGALMKRAGQEDQFRQWLVALRVRHKAKRNFMGRLDKVLPQ